MELTTCITQFYYLILWHKICLMKKIILYAFPVLFFAGLLLLSSCKKSNDAEPGSFTWTHAGKTFQAMAFAAFPNPSYFFTEFNVLAGYGDFATHVERRVTFHLNSFAVGSYTIVAYPAPVNIFDYVDDAGFNLAGISGTVNITSNVNNLLSGNFSVTLVNASSATSLITGSFTDVPIKP
jgi:hypothetical protein